MLANWSCWGEEGREREREGGRERGREGEGRSEEYSVICFSFAISIPLLPFFSQLQYTPSYHGQFDHIYHMDEVGLV